MGNSKTLVAPHPAPLLLDHFFGKTKFRRSHPVMAEKVGRFSSPMPQPAVEKYAS
jgi:hypothetical protein